MSSSLSEGRVGQVMPASKKKHQREKGDENRLVLSRRNRELESRRTKRVKAEGHNPGYGGQHCPQPKKCKW